MNQKQSRIVLTVFFVSVIAVTALLTYGIVPRVKSLKATSQDQIPRWTCIEVLAGDLIRVTHQERTNLVHLAGIASPRPQHGPALDVASKQLMVPVDELLKRAQISRKSLATWIYHRTVRVLVQPELERTYPDALEAYVHVSGVDVGKKMLQHGQAYTKNGSHPMREKYVNYETHAKKRSFGFWRN